MTTTGLEKTEQSRDLADYFRAVADPEWVRRMLEYYSRHGHYRPQDIERLLGDPTKSIEIGPRGGLPKNFSVS